MKNLEVLDVRGLGGNGYIYFQAQDPLGRRFSDVISYPLCLLKNWSFLFVPCIIITFSVPVSP